MRIRDMKNTGKLLAVIAIAVVTALMVAQIEREHAQFEAEVQASRESLRATMRQLNDRLDKIREENERMILGLPR